MEDWVSLIAIDQLIDETFNPKRKLSQSNQVYGCTCYFFNPAEEKEVFILNRYQPKHSDHKSSLNNGPNLLRTSTLNNTNTSTTTEDDVSTQSSSFSSWNEAIEPVRKALRDTTFDAIVKRTWKRPRSTDGSEAQLTNAASLAKRHINDELLQSININRVLGACRNLSAARVMLSYPGIELDAIDTANTTATTANAPAEAEYIPVVRTSENGILVKPVLPLCNPSEQLFSDTDKYSRQRFDIVCGVANALCVAASAGWPHRRLSTANIFVHTNWAGDVECQKKVPSLRSKDTNDVIEHCVKVTGFRCPVSKGCMNGSNTCKQFFQFQKKDHGKDYITKRYQEKPDDAILFADAFGSTYESVEDGENCDTVAFASFVLWLYSGVSIINPRVVGTDTERGNNVDESHLSRVPWAIRYIVIDALSDRNKNSRMSLVNTVDYLHALRQRAVKPHLLNVQFMPPTSPLFPLGLHATLSAARCDEPQAMIHLGRMCERIASVQNEVSSVVGDSKDRTKNQRRSRMREPVKRHDVNIAHTAYGLYAAAARHGETAGFLHMAGILAEWIDGRLPRPLPNVMQPRIDRIQLLRCLLRAALDGMETVIEEAISILERFTWAEKKKKVWSSMSMLLKADPDAEDIERSGVVLTFAKALDHNPA